MLLVHINQPEAAERVHNAWLKTIEDGIHTYDIFQEGVSKQKVGTKEFAQAVVARLGQKPETLKAVSYAHGSSTPKAGSAAASGTSKKELVGVDVSVHWASKDADKLAEKVKPLVGDGLDLVLISNRGQKVWPDGSPETFKVDQFACRFRSASGGSVDHRAVVSLLGRFADAKLDFVKTEHLYNFDGEQGFTAAQGE
jgi:isocitrate dehydrogenase